MTSSLDTGPSTDRARRVPDQHHDHRNVVGGWLRPAVFGAMDGLVSNASLLAGVSGGGGSSGQVALAGLAGLVGGSFSMAAGEYTSVRTQAEAARAELEIEERELARAPEAELAELTAAYRKRGLSAELAGQVATALSRDPQMALRVHAQEEFGVDPDALASPWLAAGSSFAAFALGAAIPLVPFLFGKYVWVALALTVVSLFIAGSLVSRFTARTWWYSGARQLLVGVAAAGVTYGIGRAVGTSVG